MSFAKIFSSAITDVLTELTSTPWAVREAGNPEMSKSAGETRIYRLICRGNLSGECFLEFPLVDLTKIAAGILHRESLEFEPEAEAACLEMLRAAAAKAESQFTNGGDGVSLQVETSAEVAASVTRIAPLLATDGASGRLALLLYLDQELIESLGRCISPAGQPLYSSAAPSARVAENANLSLVLDVELNLTLRFGQRKLSLRDVLKLNSGSVIELDRQVDDPVELMLGDRVIARGEAVIVDGQYGLRVTEVPSPISTQLWQ